MDVRDLVVVTSHPHASAALQPNSLTFRSPMGTGLRWTWSFWLLGVEQQSQSHSPHFQASLIPSSEMALGHGKQRWRLYILRASAKSISEEAEEKGMEAIGLQNNELHDHF